MNKTSRERCGPEARRWKTRWIAATFVVLLAGAGASHGADIRLLEPTGGGAREAAQPLVFEWDEAQVAPLWDRLAFELDGMDVTAFVQRREGGAQLALTLPLATGEHRLRVVLSENDGGLTEWGDWTFQIGARSRWQGQADLSLSLNQRVHNRGRLVANAPGTPQAEGAAQLRGEAEGTGWNASGQAQLWLNSEHDANINDRGLDLGEYLIQGQWGATRFQLGHQQLPYDSLIHSAFLRRGLSVQVPTPGAGSLSGFALRSEPLVGANAFTGVNEPDHRVGGLVLEQPLYQNGGHSLAVSAGFVSGRGNDLTPDPLGANPLHRGDAWSLAGEARWLHSRVRLRAEMARSRYDWSPGNPLPQGDSREADDAHAVLLQFGSDPSAPGGQWVLDAEHRRVGTFFRSVAHLGQPSDQLIDRLRGSWRQGAWQFGGSLTRLSTNANDLPLLPRIRVDQSQLMLAWSPPFPEQLPAYGNPSLTAQWGQVRQRQTRTPPGYPGAPVDNRSWQSGLTAALSHERWSASLGMGAGAYADAAQPGLSSRSRNLTLGAQWRIGEAWNIGPSLEWSRVLDTATRQRQTLRSASLSTDFVLLPDRLLGNLSLGLNQARRTVDSQRETNRYAVGELIWRLQKAGINRAGWDLRVSLTHQDFEDVLDFSRNGRGTQVFVGLTMNWPLSSRP